MLPFHLAMLIPSLPQTSTRVPSFGAVSMGCQITLDARRSHDRIRGEHWQYPKQPPCLAAYLLDMLLGFTHYSDAGFNSTLKNSFCFFDHGGDFVWLIWLQSLRSRRMVGGALG